MTLNFETWWFCGFEIMYGGTGTLDYMPLNFFFAGQLFIFTPSKWAHWTIPQLQYGMNRKWLLNSFREILQPFPACMTAIPARCTGWFWTSWRTRLMLKIYCRMLLWKFGETSTCECNIGGKMIYLQAGDYLEIPRFTQHTIRNTSAHPQHFVKALVQRRKAA